MQYHWDFAAVWSHFDLLLAGLIGTIKIAVISIVLGVLVGLVLALMRLSPRPWLRVPATAFVEFYRNTPPIVHFFWFFYALPILIGLNLDPYAAAVLALSTQSGAFYAEVFRGGIVSIERGQWEAAQALGMTHSAVLRRIVVPQAVRQARRAINRAGATRKSCCRPGHAGTPGTAGLPGLRESPVGLRRWCRRWPRPLRETHQPARATAC